MQHIINSGWPQWAEKLNFFLLFCHFLIFHLLVNGQHIIFLSVSAFSNIGSQTVDTDFSASCASLCFPDFQDLNLNVDVIYYIFIPIARYMYSTHCSIMKVGM